MGKPESEERLRIDRWLHAARFFKTRSEAAEAGDGGKVHLNGARTKRSREIGPGDRLRIRKGPYEFGIKVLALSPRRVSAKQALTLFEESAASVRERARLAAWMRSSPKQEFREGGRPTKKDRRELDRVRGRKKR